MISLPVLCARAVRRLAAAAAADILLTPPPPIVTDGAPPPTECRRRAGAVFVTCSRHFVHQLYMLLAFCNLVYNEA